MQNFWLLAGWIELVRDRPAFGLPIFRGAAGPRHFIQILGFDGRIERFQSVDLQSKTLLMHRGEPRVHIGDEAVSVFVDSTGATVAGTRTEIQSALLNALAQNEENVALAIQIASVLEDGEALARYRASTSLQIKEVGGDGAERSFTNSAVRTFCWGLMERTAGSAELRKLVYRNMADLDFFVDNRGNISFQCYQDNFPIEEYNISWILEEAQREFSGFAKPASPSEATHPEVDISDDADFRDFVDRNISLLRSTGRQEDRIAIIFSLATSQPNETRALLRKYNDRAQLVRRASSMATDILATKGASGLALRYEIARCISAVYSIVVGFSRGEFLVAMARKFYADSLVGAAIMRIARRSRSIYVEPHLDDIVQILGQGPNTVAARRNGRRRNAKPRR
jgi:hypothetical protein